MRRRSLFQVKSNRRQSNGLGDFNWVERLSRSTALRIAPASVSAEHVAHLLWTRLSSIVILVLLLLALAACTGSAAVLATRPAFLVETPTGPASVSIRGPLPGMTDSQSEKMIEMAMLRAVPNNVRLAPVGAPFPQGRIVWHADPDSPGISRLVVNVLVGAGPVWHEEVVVADSSPEATMIDTIGAITRRLAALNFAGSGAMSPKIEFSNPRA